MKIGHAVLLTCRLITARLGVAQTVVQDGFESGTFSEAWGLTSGVVITNTGGANGSTRCAQLAAYTAGTGQEMGDRFDAVAPEGARDFSMDLFFRAQNTA